MKRTHSGPVVGCALLLVSLGASLDLATAEEETTVSQETASQEQHDKRVDYVEFPSTDLEATKAFYGTVFGWEFQDWGPDYVSFADGRLAGGFRLADEVKADGALVVIYAVDLEAIEAAVRDAGGTILQEIFSFPGGRRFHFADPTGNELAVWSDR